MPHHTVTNMHRSLFRTVSRFTRVRTAAGEPAAATEAPSRVLVAAMNRAAGTPLSDTSPSVT